MGVVFSVKFVVYCTECTDGGCGRPTRSGVGLVLGPAWSSYASNTSAP